MVLGQRRYAVRTFVDHADAEQVLNKFKLAGIPTSQISVVSVDSKDATHKQPLGEIETEGLDEDNAQEECGAIAGTIVGSLLGGIGGCLAGLGLLLMLEISLLLAVGTSGTVLLLTLVGAGIGGASGGLIGALAGMETPED